jgi:ceramide glucosyltransferase
VVETGLGAGTWRDVWRHQLRWSRTIRVSRTGGYIGSVITHTTLWSLIAALAGAWQFSLICLGIRMVAGIFAAKWVLGASGNWLLIPLRDLWGSAVWFTALFGSTVEWRGKKLRLQPDGRIRGLQ